MALLGALCVGLNALGFTNRSLRARVSHLLGRRGAAPGPRAAVAYTVNQRSYDLARLPMKGLIHRRPGTNTYESPLRAHEWRSSTPRSTTILRRLIAADLPPAPPELRRALATVDRHLLGYTEHPRLGNAA